MPREAARSRARRPFDLLGLAPPPLQSRQGRYVVVAEVGRHAERRGRRWLEDGESQRSGAPMGSAQVGECSVSDAGRRYPTRTAAAITVVQSPCLSPTAVWVTFCVRTIWFESR